MTLGERIALRLNELGLSQADLARGTGIPRTTINSLVHGNARTTPHLIKLAKVLQTTPDYLMGEGADLKDAGVTVQYAQNWVYSQDRYELIQILDAISDEEREFLLSLIEHFLSLSKKRRKSKSNNLRKRPTKVGVK